MSEIAEDVMKAARECARAVAIHHSDHERIEVIARAIMAERHRCVEVVDCGCEPHYCPFPGNCSKDDVAAILSP